MCNNTQTRRDSKRSRTRDIGRARGQLRLSCVRPDQSKPAVGMSLVSYSNAMASVSSSHYSDGQTIQMGTAIIVVVSTMVLIRGVVSMLLDFKAFVFYVGFKRFKDQACQTDEYEYPKLPDEILFKSKSDVYHLTGCHYLGGGRDVVSKRACYLCRGKF